MNFQELSYHLQQYGCNLDHMGEEYYMATNCINACICMVEDLQEYSNITLCHYFLELGIPAPPHLTSSLEKYREFREKAIKIPINAQG